MLPPVFAMAFNFSAKPAASIEAERTVFAIVSEDLMTQS
jgi:hypothetical protein